MLRATIPRRAVSRSVSRKIGVVGFAVVPTSCTAVIERFGKFHRTAPPGLLFYLPGCDRVHAVSNRTEQATYVFEAKTKDNIFTRLQVAAQVRILPDDVEQAMYTMTDPAAQINAFLDSEIRAQVSRRKLDQLFEEQEEIVASVFTDKPNGDPSVKQLMKAAGYTIEKVLIRQIDPVESVKNAMNAINASLRLREAAQNEADAKYIGAVREAEADRDRKRLLGEGVAQQRLAILEGYKESIQEMSEKFALSPREVVDFVLKTQHLDAVEQISKSPNAKTIFWDHKPTTALAPADPGAAASEAVLRKYAAALEGHHTDTASPAAASPQK